MSPAKLNVALAVVFVVLAAYFLCQPVQLKCKTVPVHWICLSLATIVLMLVRYKNVKDKMDQQ